MASAGADDAARPLAGEPARPLAHGRVHHPSGALPRRQWLGVLLLAALLTAAFLLGLWRVHAYAQHYLDQELGIRLRNIAVAAAATVEGDSLLSWDLAASVPVNALLLETQLSRVVADNALSRVAIYALDGRPIVDTSHSLSRETQDPFLKLDLGAVEQARAGTASVTQLVRIGGTWLKAAYAPVFDAYGDVSGFTGVEASADFFQALGKLRQRLWAVGAMLVLLVAVLTTITIGYQLRLARTRAALLRSESLSAMGRMAAGIAHEIRNPLGIIKNTAQLLRGELADGTAQAQLLEFIPEEVDRLNDILTGYLDFAKQAPPRPVPLELVQLVRRILQIMTPDFQAARVRVLDNLLEVEQVRLTADPRRLQQVFLNLFLNAIQAMPDGGELRLTLRPFGRAITVEVADTGVGIDPAQRGRLFEPFVTTKEKGSGLGLSIARQIVEDHGGRIEIDGRPGAGATVTLVLPLSEQSAAGPPPAAPATPGGPAVA